jgi:hypothetical protein
VGIIDEGAEITQEYKGTAATELLEQTLEEEKKTDER